MAYLVDTSKARSKCKTCRWRASDEKRGCNYMVITGQRRGCSASKCNKYEKGPKEKMEGGIPWSGQGLEDEH